MQNNSVSENPGLKHNSKPFPIVGIGASAGGIEAMIELLENLSPETGMAYIYIQHLDREYESNLADILGRHTSMKVVTAKNLLTIEANHVYVIPPDKYISLIDGALKVSSRAPEPALNMPINFLFLSLAEKQRQGAIGIVLSGMASDGALGLKAIKLAGGFTSYVQDESAKYESMPKSAIAEGGVEVALPPRELAKELERLSTNRHLFETVLLKDDQVLEDDQEPEENNTIEELTAILSILKKNNGVDFTHYKKNTIRRRIVRRMLLQKLETLQEYESFLTRTPAEVDSLYNDLLINVTHFFRDPDVTDYLKKTLLPKLLNTKTPHDPLRIWIPACSTGEEAYSFAMLLHEVFGENSGGLPVQIFATDLSDMAITKARVGVYSTTDVQQVSPERLNRFFTKVDGHYRINKGIRDLCVFAAHNIFKDPPFSRVDIISCCNVLIYLDAVLQKKIMANFHYALNKGGYLVLGQSETVGSSIQLFSQVKKKLKIYQKKSDVASRAMFEMDYNFPAKELSIQSKLKNEVERDVSDNPNLQKLIDKAILARFSPSAVVVNHSLDIVQFRGSTGLFLEPSPGQASLNLLKMARSGLSFELRAATNKVIKTGEAEKKSGIEITHEGNVHYVAFTVSPLNINTQEQLLLVVFEDVKSPDPVSRKGDNSKNRRVAQLENELLSLRDDMNSIVEEQEAANEELQSANEEIVSSNEELQSINEELETSKEEIESSNEELMTINQELMVRNHQLAEAHDYTAAVIATIRESVLVLDSTLRVKVANTAFYRTFNTNEKEVEGRIIYEIGDHDWKIPKLKELLEDLVPRNNHFHGMEIKHVFKHVGEKVFLVNCRKVVQSLTSQQMFLLAFEDITEHKQAERLLEEREAWLRNMTDSVPVMIWVASTDKNFIFLNKTWLAFTGRKLAQETGIGWTAGIHKDDIEPFLTTYHQAFDKKDPLKMEFRIKRHDGEYRWVLNEAVPSFDSTGEFTGYIGSCTEIHDKRMLNEELEKMVEQRTSALSDANNSLEQSNSELQQFAYVASHDLQEPLRKIITFSNRLKEKYPELLNEGSGEYINKITSASHRMTLLIDDLLDFSRVAKIGHKAMSNDLNLVLKNVLADLDLLIQESKARIVTGNLPVIQALPLQMNQLFYNLLTNALKFTQKDKAPVINITSRRLTPEEVAKRPRFNPSVIYYEMLVKDEGIGFPQEYAEQIFVIFQRLNDRQQYAGTGIGLALCKKIVENHGGEIYARSNEGDGSGFYVILPDVQTNK